MKCFDFIYTIIVILSLAAKQLTCFSHFFSSRTSESQIETIIAQIPKVELHAHLHGSVRHSTLRELAETQNATDSVNKFSLDHSDIGLLQKPFELFPVVHSLVNSLPVVKRILTEMIEDYYQDNTMYLEIRTTPRALSDGTSKSQYVEALVEQIYHENQNWKDKILTKLILSFDRSKSIIDAQETYQLAKKFRYFQREQIIVGLDFAGNPLGGSFDDFENLLLNAREENFNITIHIAESKEQSEANPNNPQQQDETSKILKFRPDRLGHFLHMKDHHFKTLLQLKDKGQAPLIEVCPTTAFYLLGLSSYADHPHIRQLLKYQYPFSINTDDSGIFSSSLLQEILHFHRAIELKLFDIIRSLETSIDYSFATEEEKEQLRGRYWSRLMQVYSQYPTNEELASILHQNNDGEDIDMSSLYTM